MKKGKLLNSEISSVISQMGHTDSLTIGDCGLPIPKDVKRIDLALKYGVPSFLDTLDTVLEELCVEEIIIAEEIKEAAEQMYKEILNRFENVKVTVVKHEEFKVMTKDSHTVIRTGECTPYSNIILKSGVVF
ncbi:MULTISPECIES: D-ribose pyranase [Paraclostridium]|uniref:D-ribose pyranase n=1 Tax=Paraclostridium bifermentans TaxID=1490 RepID=A0A5P3XBR4_PARBF|nr:D-ribose pyranase [Paraclostridium bifermentans]MCU9807205.1 D-ribose pyranase [Paraclostridium sp. AKS46]MDV8114414.1 D-ribose pyranase [Bacillus sp. BAU-SS-2023]EQK41765.1 rbsD / FucU transport family protein [[Clostridium] bifermentans ATCC 19299] [Paraclostridium bifermentans ATCC 19299]MCE9674959.1 D-ribose pyranase [Paraclostridium bifermentans]MCR1874466.1 D-ribose pyranase [Paraclostridium bifermentans]